MLLRPIYRQSLETGASFDDRPFPQSFNGPAYRLLRRHVAGSDGRYRDGEQSPVIAEELIAFEADIAAEFNAARIRAPVHLSGGNEEQLIEIFKNIALEDWVFTTWRSHYHCLLKGVPPAQLKADIMAGRSITLNYPEHRIVSSAIVGGILPIALGVALAIKRNGGKNKVFVFVGDMTERTGTFHECLNYAIGHLLPIRFITEDNGLSVCTTTQDVWGGPQTYVRGLKDQYSYKLPWPHSGAGVRVQF
jgi:hypothetical protein